MGQETYQNPRDVSSHMNWESRLSGERAGTVVNQKQAGRIRRSLKLIGCSELLSHSSLLKVYATFRSHQRLSLLLLARNENLWLLYKRNEHKKTYLEVKFKFFFFITERPHQCYDMFMVTPCTRWSNLVQPGTTSESWQADKFASHVKNSASSFDYFS